MRAASDLVELARAFASIVERIAERDAEPGLDGQEWVDQLKSPLGARLHCAAVRRRRAEGKGGAAIKNRRHLLTREALTEEMMHSPKPGLRKTTGHTGQATSSSTDRARATVERLRSIRARKG